MIIHMKPKAKEHDIKMITKRVKDLGFDVDLSKGTESTIIGIKGNASKLDENIFIGLPGVGEVIRISEKWKELSREYRPEDTVVDIDGKVKIGNGYFTVMAGPCAIESEYQLRKTAELVKKAGADILRAGAFKPRTSPYDFQGLGPKGIELLAKVKEEFDIPVVTEITDMSYIELFKEHDIDIYQVGARNSQNFELLKKLADLGKPVLHKRGTSLKLNDFLCAAEYIYSGNGSNKGNPNVMLCERGTFPSNEEKVCRNNPDIPAIHYIKQNCHLPIIGDPSHSSGKRELVPYLSFAMTAAGADGIIIEAHYDPNNALCDKNQAVKEELSGIIKTCKQIKSVKEEYNSLYDFKRFL